MIGPRVKSIAELSKERPFLVTVEINPPASSDVAGFLEEVKSVADRADAVNITDMPGANLKMSPWGAGLWALRSGANPIVQYTCRDRNRLALKGDAYALESFGVRNVLVLGGDPPNIGNEPSAKAVYDMDTVSFIGWISENTSLCVGAAVNPGAEDLEVEKQKCLAKASAGARFFQTQAVYTKEVFLRFLDKVGDLGVPILVGIIPLRSEKMARFMNANIPGIEVPEWMIEEIGRLNSPEDKIKYGIDQALRLIEDLRPYCAGVHLMPIKGVRLVLPILETLKGEAR